MSQEKISALAELFVKALDHFFLCLFVEIDDNVPAEYDIHVADQACLIRVEEVQVTERHELAHPVGDAVITLFLFNEIFCQHLRARHPVRALFVDPLACGMQNPLVDVAAKDLHLPVTPPIPGLKQEDSYGIWLFPRGASSTPYPDNLAVCKSLAQFGKDFLGESTELRALAEKIGLIRGEVVHKNGKFLFPLPIITEKMVVLLETSELTLLKSPHEPALQEELGAVIEVYAAVAMNEIPEKPEDVVWQRDRLFFNHLSPQCVFRRLPHGCIRISVGDPFQKGLRRCVLFLFNDLDSCLSHAPVRIGQSRKDGLMHGLPMVAGKCCQHGLAYFRVGMAAEPEKRRECTLCSEFSHNVHEGKEKNIGRCIQIRRKHFTGLLSCNPSQTARSSRPDPPGLVPAARDWRLGVVGA